VTTTDQRPTVDTAGLPRDKCGWYVIDQSVNWLGIAMILGGAAVMGLLGWGALALARLVWGG
jgi:hypothetical protein